MTPVKNKGYFFVPENVDMSAYYVHTSRAGGKSQ